MELYSSFVVKGSSCSPFVKGGGLKWILIQACAFCLLFFFSQFSFSADDNIAAIKNTFAKNFPQISVMSVTAAPVKNFYQVELNTGETLYVSSDTRYFFAGDLIQLQGRSAVNLTEQVRLAKRQATFKALDKKSMIVFSPPTQTPIKANIYVFTDVDCAYCRRFHAQVPQLNQLGIQVNYLAWPRTGVNSVTARTMESIWCAKDRKAALTAAKNSKQLASASCKNPIADQFALGLRLGVQGTPAIFLENGKQVGGYLTTEQVLSVIR